MNDNNKYDKETKEDKEINNKISLEAIDKKMNTSKRSKSIKEALKINSEFYEQCSELNVILRPEDYTLYLNKFRDTSNIEDHYLGLVGLSKLSLLYNNYLSFNYNKPPIHIKYFAAALVLDFVKLLESNYEEIKLEALICLENITCCVYKEFYKFITNSIFTRGGIPKIINLVDSEITEIQTKVKIKINIKQAIKFIDFIVKESDYNLEVVYKAGGLTKIANLLDKAYNIEIVNQCMLTLYNIFRSKHTLPFNDYEIETVINFMNKQILGLLVKFLTEYENNELFKYICWIFKICTEKIDKSIKILADLNAIPKILTFIK